MTSVAFGPGLFAFSVYRRGVYLTDLRSPERLVARGRDASPLDFTAAGSLVVVGRRTITLVSRSGGVLRRVPFVSARGVALDRRSDTLYFVTPSDVLATSDGTQIHLVRSIESIEGSFTLADAGLLTWGAANRLTVTTRNADVVASDTWPKKLGTPDLGVATSDDGALFALRVSNASPGKRNGGSHVLVLRRGEHAAREIFSHRYARIGCGLPGSLSWHGHVLLYDPGQGRPVIFDVDSGSRSLALARFAPRLPHQGVHDLPTAAWLSDLAG